MMRLLKTGTIAGLLASGVVGLAMLPIAAEAAPPAKKAMPAKGAAMKGGAMKSGGAMKGGAMKSGGAAKGSGKAGGDPLNAAAGKKM